MLLLIDGYNLLHATDLFGAGELAGTLRGSREALVSFLSSRMTAKERRGTVIVFDAKDAPPGLPDRYEQAGLDLRFARDYPDADAMIEAILEPLRSARGLTVVSGDRRVQRAARSRGAKPIDSDEWFADLCRRAVVGSPDAAASKPSGSVGTPAEWVEAFSDPEALAEIERQAAASPLPRPAAAEPPPEPERSAAEPSEPPRKRRRRPPLADAGDKPTGDFGAGVRDPFPPGYGEDLLPPDE